MEFNSDILKIDCKTESQRVEKFIQQQVFNNFKKKGIVVGISGGIDSAVIASLSVRAIGKDKVIGLILPEKESNPISAQYAKLLIDKLGIYHETVEITPMLESFGVYKKRESIIKSSFPDFESTWKYRLVMPQNLLEKDRFNISSLEVRDPQGNVKSKRLASQDYLGMVAATNIKQRVRMTTLYYYSEKNNYIVAGTTNLSETLQGFFVKYGDGGVDIESIAHLYKTQVYQLSEYLNIPQEIIDRPPSPDTYSLTASDKEIYFCLPFDILDLLLYAKQNKIPRDKIKNSLKLNDQQIDRAFRDFDTKQKATEHFRHLPPSLSLLETKSGL